MNFLEYTTTFTSYSLSDIIDSNCNSLVFYNAGTTVCIIENAIPLQPNASFPIDGNLGEVIKKTFQFAFSGAGVNNLVVIRKTYL